MKLAICCAAGNLHRFGYQNVMGPCVKSWAFADRIYATASDNKALVPGAEMISDERTWFEDGRFDIHHIVRNLNLAIDKARQDGMNVALVLDVNCYVPNGKALRKYCQTMLDDDWQYGFTYRADQLGPAMFHTSGKRPRIMNLAYGWQIGCDKIVLDGNEISYDVSDYSDMDDVAFIDCGLEMTVADMAAKMNYIRCYQELVPKRSKEFHWDYWFPYYVAKFRAKKRNGQARGEIAEAIAAAGNESFASWKILEAL